MRTLFRALAALIERLLGVDEEAAKADMHLSNKHLALSAVAVLAVFILISRYITTTEWIYLLLAAAFLVMSVGILLCYKNQRIYIISDEEFRYSTMFGRKTVYKFSNILMLRKNRDSLTLLVHDGKPHKIHIESGAIMSNRLIELINKALAEAQKNKGEIL